VLTAEFSEVSRHKSLDTLRGYVRRSECMPSNVGISSMWAAETLKQWHDFYLLVGTAGATLLGLLFIAVSLGAGYLTEERQSGTRTFMSPVVIHFTSVFFLSAIALFPSHQARFFAALIGGTASIGAVVSTYITIQVVRTDMTTMSRTIWPIACWPASVTSRCSRPLCRSI
jgi:hypothetical protein